MGNSLASLFRILLYLSLALLAFGALLHLRRVHFHRSFLRMPGAQQLRLLSIWRRLLLLTRAFLILAPIPFVLIAVLLDASLDVPITATAPVLLLIYLNMLLIHANRSWHAHRLSPTAKAPENNVNHSGT